jgi:hypothetical protein
LSPLLLAGVPEAELVAAYGGTADENWLGVLEGEIERRESEERAAAQAAAVARSPRADYRQAERAEWHDAAHAQYLRAEAECNGYLVRGPHHDYRDAPGKPGKCEECGNAAGYPRHRGTDAFALWTGSEEFANCHATEELRAFWDRERRITVSEYQRQAAAGRADAREVYRNDQLDRDARSTVRPDASARAQGARDRGDGGTDTVPGRAAGDRAAQDNAAAGATARAGGPVRRGGAPVGIAGMTAAEQVARLHQRADEIRARTASRTVVPATTDGTIAVRDRGAVVRQQPPVDGAQVLGYTRQLIDRYARMPSEAAADVVALWAAHTHCRGGSGGLLFETTPRLALLSSVPGSGKSRILNLTRMLCGGRYGLLTEPTAWALAHILGPSHEAAFIDEADILFGRGARKESVRAVLNAGYQRDGVIAHMRGRSVEDLAVFGPVAFAGLDSVRTTTGASLAPLFTRTITIRMRQAADPVPPLDHSAREAAGLLHAAFGAWAGQNRDRLEDLPELPDWLANRDGEVWSPILAVAEAAGGDWPDRALTAAAELCGAWEQPRDDADYMTALAGMTADW